MSKKSFLLIGMGKFGHYLCRMLASAGHDLMIVDRSEDRLSDLLGPSVSAKIGDCTRRDVLKSFGVDNFDACVVCVAEDFQSSLEVTDLLRELGARRILSVAATDTQARFLLKNGADEVIFPERDIAERIAVSIGNDSVFDYFELSDAMSIYEILPPKKWLGRSIKELNVRATYRISVLAYRGAGGALAVPGIDYVFCADEHVFVMGLNTDVDRLI